MKVIKVLSLFDGISCGHLALINLYYSPYYLASEIDKDAIKVTKINFPGTIQLGDIKSINPKTIGDIDLIMGGSPCQGFSIAGKQLNFNDSRSKLFFDFVRILNKIKPKYFLFENVVMKKEYMDIISSELGVHPIMINSNKFSAQDRKRNYWTNIPLDYNDIDKLNNSLTVEDILQKEVPEKYWIDPQRAITICDNEVKKKKIAYIGSDNQSSRIYSIHNKSVTLCGNGGGLGAKMGIYALPYLTPGRLIKRQNGRRFKPPHSKFYTLTTQDQHGILINNAIRLLTPVECERLQNIPDNYTQMINSDNKRYKLIGNAWTVKVIEFILSGMKY